jgi:hypothetical protein
LNIIDGLTYSRVKEMRELVVLMLFTMASPDDARTDQTAVVTQPLPTAETVPVMVPPEQSAAAGVGASRTTARATALDAPH